MKHTIAAAMLTLAMVGGAARAADDDLGARLYLNHCAACHGFEGEGDGPVAATMRASVPNLRTLAQRSNGVFPADSVAAYIDGREINPAHGDRQMPIWGDVFRGPQQGTAERTVKRRIAAIMEFLEALQYR